MKKEYPKEDILKLYTKIYPFGEPNEETIFEYLVSNSSHKQLTEIGKYKGRTTVYNIWHITRIEDITMNSIVMNQSQVFNDEWKKRMHSSIRSTGNELDERGILSFSKDIDFEELICYRNEVTKRSIEIINNLDFNKITTKLSKENYGYLIDTKDVDKSNEWLISYWTGTDVRRIIYTPLLSHHLMHLNQSIMNITK